MGSKVYEYKVEMSCGGCQSAVEKVLNKLEGADKVDVSLEEQKVWVTATITPEEVLEVIKKTGKKAEYIGEKK